MEKRSAKISISAAGGTAGKDAKTYKLTIPSAWAAAMGITENDRGIELSFDGERITAARPSDTEQFMRQGTRKEHKMKTPCQYTNNSMLGKTVYLLSVRQKIHRF